MGEKEEPKPPPRPNQSAAGGANQFPLPRPNSRAIRVNCPRLSSVRIVIPLRAVIIQLSVIRTCPYRRRDIRARTRLVISPHPCRRLRRTDKRKCARRKCHHRKDFKKFHLCLIIELLEFFVDNPISTVQVYYLLHRVIYFFDH